MSDPIKAALKEAQLHAVGNDGEPIPAAPIIAAFLRALPSRDYTPVYADDLGLYGVSDLAAAVERAAREGGDG